MAKKIRKLQGWWYAFHGGYSSATGVPLRFVLSGNKSELGLVEGLENETFELKRFERHKRDQRLAHRGSGG
jgi:hypothetical protein